MAINYELLIQLCHDSNIPIRKAKPNEEPGVYVSDNNGGMTKIQSKDLIIVDDNDKDYIDDKKGYEEDIELISHIVTKNCCKKRCQDCYYNGESMYIEEYDDCKLLIAINNITNLINEHFGLDE